MPQKENAMSQQSAVEYVRGLSIEDREAVFADLLKECIAGHAPLNVFEFTDGTERLGFYFSAQAVEDQFNAFGPKLSPEYLEELERRESEEGIPIDEVIANLKRRVAELQRSEELVAVS